ncbi:hypothetical protein J7E62_15580 [Variovorax paradoxus]|nr:hypothetical protein [Variovorax paradoxus]
MRKDDHRDPWMNQSREPMTNWERALRPSKRSNRVLFLLAAFVALVVVLALANGWRDGSLWSNQLAPRSEPVSFPQPSATPAPGNEVRGSEVQPAPRIQRFSKCVSRTGAAAYSDGPCPAGTQASTVSVKPDINLADGMTPEARAASIRKNSAVAQTVIEHERRVAMNVDDSGVECAQLNSLVAAIDAAARQALSGSEQDRLKEQRKRARDRQFALRCG